MIKEGQGPRATNRVVTSEWAPGASEGVKSGGCGRQGVWQGKYRDPRLSPAGCVFRSNDAEGEESEWVLELRMVCKVRGSDHHAGLSMIS